MAGLYLHIPFCVKKCDYCDFTSFALEGSLEAYVCALIREIELSADSELNRLTFDTVFFGGGTPSLLSGEQMQRIFPDVKPGDYILGVYRPDGARFYVLADTYPVFVG